MENNLENTCDYLVSVIVPVYNVEKYLCECVDSILAQTYKNLEVILVDDGSTDSCPKICDEYAKHDKRVLVVHQKNGGLSAARNAGAEVATGEYIVFVDSDDFVSCNFIETLLEPVCAGEKNCVVACSYKKFGVGEKLQTKQDVLLEAEILQSGNSRFAKLSLFDFMQKNGWMVSCAKLYKTSVCKKNKFPVGKLHEDEFTTYKFCYESDAVVYTEKELYFYRQHSGSIMAKRNIKNYLNIEEALRERILFFVDKENVALTDLSIKFYVNLICDLCKRKYSVDDKKALETLVVNARNFIKPFCKRLEIYIRIKYFIAVHLPYVFYAQAKIRGTL